MGGRVIPLRAKTAAKAAVKKLASESRGLIRVTGIPVGCGLRTVGVTATERLSGPFEVYLEMEPVRSSAFDLDEFAGRVIGQPIGVAVRPSLHQADAVRHFHGEVFGVHLTDAAGSGGVPHVIIELRPTLYKLTHTADTRLHTGKSVKEIVSAVLDAHGLACKYRWHLPADGGPRPREFCWQLRETDLQFVERLLAEEGYQYWFTADAGGHILHLAAGAERLPVIGGEPLQIGVIGPDGDGGGRVGHLRRSLLAGPKQYVVTGRSADGESAVSGTAAAGRAGTAGTVYESDGTAETATAGKAQAARRLAVWTAASRTAEGSSDLRAMAAGTVAAVLDRGSKRPVKLRLTAVRHQASQAAGVYTNTFEAVPADAPFAPPRRAKPPLPGVTPATVADGPDADGRYRLRFDLDRTQTPSGWVPLAREQDSQFLPRPGQRVLVECVEADPDRPRIVRQIDPPGGKPFCPAANPLLGGIVTPAHELLFQSDPADPWVKVRAGGEYEEVVSGERHASVGTNRTEAVGGNANWSIGGNADWSVGGGWAGTVGGAFGLSADTVTVRGGTRIAFVVGGSYIVLDSSGITVNGKPLLHLNPPGGAAPSPPPDAKKPADRKSRQPKPQSKKKA